EFSDQAQQLVHGAKDERLRTRGTRPALAALAGAGYVDPGLAARLASAYRFLRDVEHKLQIVHERQTQRVATDPEEIVALARRLGFAGADARERFETARAGHGAAVRAAFDALFHGAEVERRRDAGPELGPLVEE